MRPGFPSFIDVFLYKNYLLQKEFIPTFYELFSTSSLLNSCKTFTLTLPKIPTYPPLPIHSIHPGKWLNHFQMAEPLRPNGGTIND
jgi:hypothetical protein